MVGAFVWMITGVRQRPKDHGGISQRQATVTYKQRCITGILAVAIMGTIVATQLWLPKRSPAAPAARQAGRIAPNPAAGDAVLKKEGEKKGK